MKIDISQIDSLEPENKKEALKLLEEVGYYLKYSTRLVKFFEQAYPFQRALFNSTADRLVTGLISGNRVGKTEATAAFVACAATGVWPSWYTGYRFENKPLKIAVAGSTAQQLRLGLQEKLFGTENRNDEDAIGTGFVPKDAIGNFNKGRDGSIGSTFVSHVSGGKSFIEFTQYTQSDQAFQGASFDLFCIDEEPGEKFYQQALKRIAIAPHSGLEGRMICSFTPEHAEDGYVMKQFWGLPRIAGYGEEFEGSELDYNIFDNEQLSWKCINAGWPSVAHITDQMQQTLLHGTPEYLHQTVMWGKPMLGGGAVFPVDPDMIVYNPDATGINEQWPHLLGIDFGYTRDPGAAVLVAWDENNDTIYVDRAWKGKSQDRREFARNVSSVEPNCPVIWPRDGAGRVGKFKGGTTEAAIYQEMGLNLLPECFKNPPGLGKTKQPHEIEPGLTEIRSRMYSGRLKINKNLIELLEEIDGYRYDTDGKPKKYSVDHLIDALRYAVMTIIQGYGEALYGSHNPWTEEEEEEYFHNSY